MQAVDPQIEYNTMVKTSRNTFAAVTFVNLLFTVVFLLVSFSHPWFLLPSALTCGTAAWMMTQLAK